jgi:type IX secretion system PorP/SprF family membrane protein
VYYSRERFYAGISAPDLIQNSFLVADMPGGNGLVGKERRHYFLIAGMLVNMSDNMAFKPTTLVKVVPGAMIQVDLTASFIIKKRILAGFMFRSGDSFGGLVGFDITNQFHLGYSYDWSYGLRTGTYNRGSHELVLRFDVLLSKKQANVSEGPAIFKNSF